MKSAEAAVRNGGFGVFPKASAGAPVLLSAAGKRAAAKAEEAGVCAIDSVNK